MAAKFKEGDLVILLDGSHNDPDKVCWVDESMTPNIGKIFTIERAWKDRSDSYYCYKLKECEHSFTYSEVWLAPLEVLEPPNINDLISFI